MKVKLVEKETFAWRKHLKVEVEGVTYNARLDWDIHGGYDLNFYDNDGKWVAWHKWAEDYDNAMRDIYSDLDSDESEGERSEICNSVH